MRATIRQITTFALEPFRGNPAFVVSVPQDLPDPVFQQIAGQLGTLILASMRLLGRDRWSLRFHTPTGAHSGAGHATLAAAHVALADGQDAATLVLADGSERIVRRHADMIAVPWAPMPGIAVAMEDRLGSALGQRPSATLVAPFGYVAVFDDLQTIRDMVPDLDRIGELDRGAVIATAPGDESDFVVRVFAPKLDLPEDPVCGTAHRILAPYWSSRLGKTSLHSRHLSPRGGDLFCRIEGGEIFISGRSVTFLEGTLDLQGP